jgi:geranylgeranyl pyrophosphate synthase
VTASSRSMSGQNLTECARDLRVGLPNEVSKTMARVEDQLVEVAVHAPEVLVAPALAMLTAGGKRLRPLLLVLCAGMGDPDRDDLVRAATAIEVLHTATLIHDDIVDRAESRRGIPTIITRYGREIAVATGDYLFAEASLYVATIQNPRLVPTVVEAVKGLAAGEWEQYRANGATLEVEPYLSHIRKKTAGLFKAACVAGGTLGGLSRRQVDSLSTYGQALGIAFQMSDDIMDLVGKPGLMGKGIGTDLAEGIVTLPVILALQEDNRAVIRRVLDTPDPGPRLLEAGIEAVLATDAIRRTEAWASSEAEVAREVLKLLPDMVERTILETIVSEMVGRDA